MSLVLPSYVVFSKNYFLDYFHLFLVSLLICVGFGKHSQNLDDKVVFSINVLKENNFEIEALKRKNVLSKSKMNVLIDYKSNCTRELLLDSQLFKTS